MVEVSQNKAFLQKIPSKTAFGGDSDLDQVFLEGDGTPNFKSTDAFNMFPEKFWASAFRFYILCDRYTSKQVNFTFFDTT